MRTTLDTCRAWLRRTGFALGLGLAGFAAWGQVPSSIATTWKINGNGYLGDLVVNQAPDGRITGTIYGQPIDGYYASGAGTVAFIRYQAAKPYQMFTGAVSAQGMRGDFFPLGPDGGASAGRSRFEWTATQAQAFIGPAPAVRPATVSGVPLLPPMPATGNQAASPQGTAQPATAAPSTLRFSGHEVVRAPAINAVGVGQEVTTLAQCTPGKVVSGFTGSMGGPTIDEGANVIEIAPSTDGSAFRYTAFNGRVLDSAIGPPSFFGREAICIDRPEGYAIVESTRRLQSKERVAFETACPAGKVLIGGGTRTGRAVYTAASGPNAAGDAWWAHFRNDLVLPGAESVQVFAICASERYAPSRTMKSSPPVNIPRGSSVTLNDVTCGGGKGLSAGHFSTVTTIYHAGPWYLVRPNPPRAPHTWIGQDIRNIDADRAEVGFRALCGTFL